MQPTNPILGHTHRERWDRGRKPYATIVIIACDRWASLARNIHNIALSTGAAGWYPFHDEHTLFVDPTDMDT